MLKAVGDNILLRQVDLEETTQSGIVVKAKYLTPIYEIVSMSDTLSICKNGEECPYSIGDYVIIDKRSGSNMRGDDTKVYRHVKSWEILAIIER